MIGRRELLSGLGGCAGCATIGAWPTGPAHATKFRPRTGCVVRGREAARALGSGILSSRNTELPNLVEGRSRTTGDIALNRSLDTALQRLAETFSVWPKVGFYDDDKDPNAMAIWYQRDGKKIYAVVFGRTYFCKLLAYDPTGITFLQTAAHEFGHVWMYQSGQLDKLLKDQPTVKRAELHADYLSGYYLGLRKRAHPTASFRSAGMKRWESGDAFLKDPHHHGTPKQRLDAAEAGFLLAYQKSATPKEAFAAATAYVQKF